MTDKIYISPEEAKATQEKNSPTKPFPIWESVFIFLLVAFSILALGFLEHSWLVVSGIAAFAYGYTKQNSR